MTYHTDNETKNHASVAQIVAKAIADSIETGDEVVIDVSQVDVAAVAAELEEACEDFDDRSSDLGYQTFSGRDCDGDEWSVRINH